MNSSSVADQTGKSFKTFILTLSISLIVFSAAYYFISESSDGSSGTLGAKSSAATPVKETSVFKELSETPSNVEERAVLALTDSIGGTDSTVPATTTPATTTTATEEDAAVEETTGSAVPSTGTTETTVGLVLSALAFAVGFLVIKKDPRKLALRSFESSVLK
jgi:hypothetical protein